MKHRRGKSELHRAVCSLTARAGDGFHRGGRTSPVRKVPQKTYRPVRGAMLSAAPKAPGGNTGGEMRGKGETVRVASAPLKYERTAQAAMPVARQTPHGARPNRRGGAARSAMRPRFSVERKSGHNDSRVGCLSPAAMPGLEE